MSTLFSEGGPEAEVTPQRLRERMAEVARAWCGDAERVLLLPPDHTRAKSFAGKMAAELWSLLEPDVRVDVMPALGTHHPMTEAQLRRFFGETIPMDRFRVHRWDGELDVLGTIDGLEIDRLSGGRLARAGVIDDLPVAVNPAVTSGGYDVVLSLGQVVPHEVVGLANYTKNVMIGVGGKPVIDRSHLLGAVYGMERVMGRAETPVRRLLDRMYREFVEPRTRVGFVLSVVEGVLDGSATPRPVLRGLFASRDNSAFREAAALSRMVNLTDLDRPIRTCVVKLDAETYASTWLGNKAIYRTRMAMATGGRLVVLAPGVKRFGENARTDPLIARFGYHGTPRTLAAMAEHAALRAEASVAAHLIHGSGEGRFGITYATRPENLPAEAVRGVGFDFEDHDAAVARLDAGNLRPGWNDRAGEEVFYVPDPGIGLWSADTEDHSAEP
ncbi:nickel-dependent lactate racemase family protein [Phycisphaera mikurensis]|uniref:Uncharacterized protein n=1 Tax=Phycisphaera mikurensis (strain NBRC 102666 / KCTC 22515 / FYK2301M01) TaxID=1142394 RepID=I0IGU2_PHYMF|nr:lactate racemase domain-containing protein [Phycisphaera mikurensis]MBB6440737.1 nickel-dependent lactate racemase [Phycisphaera mikurensis]BAM04480.1 hypothetical protein PSMK_23210 [Phycisphaera mikurensis NBRC 102666]